MDGLINHLFYAIYFLLAVFLAFFIPGNIFLKKFNLPAIPKICLSILLGISLWVLQGFILGYLGLRDLTYLYLLISIMIWIKLNYSSSLRIPKLKINHEKEDLIITIILIAGVGLQILSIIGNAVFIKQGLFFCCGGADALFHASLSKQLISNFPPFEPGISGYVLHNYHFLSNLVVADLVRIFHLPFLLTEFQLIPILMSILLGLSAYTFASLLKTGKIYTIFFLFFIFFFSDVLYLLTLITTGQINFNVSTIETSLSLWVSYTRYFGIVLFLGSISFLLLWIKNKEFKYLIPMILVSGALIGFKVYFGIMFLCGLGALLIYFALKKDSKTVIYLTLPFIISLILYISVNNGSGGLIFTGFWRVEDFAANKNLGLINLELARRIFVISGNIKSYVFDILFLLTYLFFSAGILLTSFLNSKNNLKKIDLSLNIFLFFSFIGTFILGMFFIQKTGGSNSSQFLISIFLIGTIYASLFFSSLFTKRNIALKLVIIFLIILALPKTLYTAHNDFNKLYKEQGMIINNSYLKSFSYLNNFTSESSVIIVDKDLGNVCLILPFMTNDISYSCSFGSPGDRGINIETIEKEQEKILAGGTTNSKADFILTSKEIKNKKLIYKDNGLRIYKYE